MCLQGNEFFVAKDYKNAIEWYSKAIDVDPSNEAYYSNRSGERLDLKRQTFRKLCRESPFC